ncbi:MAG: hypothetical protein LIP16_18875 [Clostridium sp.]|nr:hypothetical protein [Clostridium sp.]
MVQIEPVELSFQQSVPVLLPPMRLAAGFEKKGSLSTECKFLKRNLHSGKFTPKDWFSHCYKVTLSDWVIILTFISINISQKQGDVKFTG